MNLCASRWPRRIGHGLLGTLCALLLALAPGCGDDGGSEPEPEPEQVDPISIARAQRALTIDPGDIAVARASVSLDEQEIPTLFPRVVLQRQLHDEIPYTGSDEERAFGRRIDEIWGGLLQDYPPFEKVVVVLDLFTADGAHLVGPSTLRENMRTFLDGPGARYPLHILAELEAALRAVVPDLSAEQELLVVVGRGLNRMDPDEFAAFKSFYAQDVRALVQRVAQDLDHPIDLSTALDWDFFLHQAAAAGPNPDYATAWDAMIEGIADAMVPYVIESQPDAESPADLDDDHYQRLRKLLPAEQAVAFLNLYWPCNGAEDTYGAEEFLRRFRTLAGGFNLRFVAWPRFVDLDQQACGRWASSLGASSTYCYSGLVSSVGRPKSLWTELLDER